MLAQSPPQASASCAAARARSSAWTRNAGAARLDRGAGHLPPEDRAGLRSRAPARRALRRARTTETHEVLRDYSEALGIAYQIRDDLEDSRRGRLGRRASAAGRRCSLAIALQSGAEDGAANELLCALCAARARPTRERQFHAILKRARPIENGRGTARSVQGASDSNAARPAEREPEGTAAPRGRQDLRVE